MSAAQPYAAAKAGAACWMLLGAAACKHAVPRYHANADQHSDVEAT